MAVPKTVACTLYQLLYLGITTAVVENVNNNICEKIKSLKYAHET